MVKEGDLHRLAKNAEDAEAQELHRVFAEDGPMNPEPQTSPSACVFCWKPGYVHPRASCQFLRSRAWRGRCI